MKNTILVLIAIIITGFLSSCNDYGEKISINNTDLYYKDSVSIEEANTMLSFLDKSGFVDGNSKSVQFIKDLETGNFIFKMIVDEDIIANKEYDAVFNLFPKELSEGFNNLPVDLYLCDSNFKTLKIYLLQDAPNFINAKSTEVRYTKNVKK